MSKANYENLTPILFLQRANAVYPNKIAIIDEEQTITYNEFYTISSAIASNLIKLGCQYGDKIAFLSGNCSELLISHYSIPMTGCILVPINNKLDTQTITYILKHSEAKVLFTENSLLKDEYIGLVEKVICFGDNNVICSEKILNYKDIIRSDTFNTREIKNENDTIVINYTSGTTDDPKGAECTHRSVYLNSLGECIESGLSFNSNYLWILPMFHCNGWCFTWAVTAVGGTHVCTIKAFDKEKIIKTILEYNITHFCAAPTVLKMIAEADSFLSLNKKSITILTAGSSPDSLLLKKYYKLGINVIPVYGLTETHGPTTVAHSSSKSVAQKSKIQACQGFPSIHGIHVRVVNKRMEDVPKDGKTLGEIIMRGNNIMKEYHKDAKGTKTAFKNGWFHSGDMAVVRLDGYIEIKDRIKDIIISGGENICSIEVEKIIYQHPNVLFVAVIPMKDEKWGEIVHAIIELKENMIVSKDEIREFCKQKLANFKCPKIITFDKIPLTSTGKVRKNILKGKYYDAKPAK